MSEITDSFITTVDFSEKIVAAQIIGLDNGSSVWTGYLEQTNGF